MKFVVCDVGISVELKFVSGVAREDVVYYILLGVDVCICVFGVVFFEFYEIIVFNIFLCFFMCCLR